METLFFKSTCDTVTLFWDKPKQALGKEKYTVLLNEKVIASTDKTHFTATALPQNSNFEAKIKVRGVCIAAKQVHTVKRRVRVDVTRFGVVGDGKTMNTLALQQLINRCKPEEELYFPAGIYLTGALRLHSHMSIFFAENAVLQGTEQPSDYLPRIPSRFEGIEMECYSSLLNMGDLDHTSGENCHDILIYGKGTIAGGGSILADRIIATEKERLKDFLDSNDSLIATCENDCTIPGRVRPRLINMSNCRNIRLSGLTIQNGPCWNVHMIYCNEIVTDHCFFKSDGVWNGDGWDPDSSENCTLFACRFQTGDDSVAIKSGKNPQGNRINRPTKHIRVFDCVSTCGNGICMGSEMSGGIEDIRIWDCDIQNSRYGIEIKGTKKRGGYVRDVSICDVSAPRILIHSVPYNDDGVPAEHPPVFENYKFHRITLTGKALMGEGKWEEVAPIEITGFDDRGYQVCNVCFKDVHLHSERAAVELKQCERVVFENLSCTADEGE